MLIWTHLKGANVKFTPKGFDQTLWITEFGNLVRPVGSQGQPYLDNCLACERMCVGGCIFWMSRMSPTRISNVALSLTLACAVFLICHDFCGNFQKSPHKSWDNTFDALVIPRTKVYFRKRKYIRQLPRRFVIHFSFWPIPMMHYKQTFLNSSIDRHHVRLTYCVRSKPHVRPRSSQWIKAVTRTRT